MESFFNKNYLNLLFKEKRLRLAIEQYWISLFLTPLFKHLLKIKLLSIWFNKLLFSFKILLYQ